jgi:hypothetical protein
MKIRRLNTSAMKTSTPSPVSTSKPPLGSGERFKALEGKLSSRGARNPAALAAYIGRKKYGAKRFGQLSAGGRKRRINVGKAGVASGGKRRYL